MTRSLLHIKAMVTPYSLFPRVGRLDDRDPHGAFVLYAEDLMDSSALMQTLGRILHAMLQGDPPGFGLEYVGFIDGSFEDEYMLAEGVEPFPAGTRFWVGSNDLTYFDAVMYSRAELCGWLTLALIKFDRAPLDESRFLDLMRKLWSPHSCLDALRSKLDGIEPWAFGPVGCKLSDGDLAWWRAQHTPGFSERYFGT